MNIRITPSKLKGSITPPPSKSQAHRLLIAAALGKAQHHPQGIASFGRYDHKPYSPWTCACSSSWSVSLNFSAS